MANRAAYEDNLKSVSALALEALSLLKDIRVRHAKEDVTELLTTAQMLQVRINHSSLSIYTNVYVYLPLWSALSLSLSLSLTHSLTLSLSSEVVFPLVLSLLLSS